MSSQTSGEARQAPVGVRALPAVLRGRGAGSLQRLALPVTWLVSGCYIGVYWRRGWVPHDEGTIVGNAERFLSGALPHRDFVDVYTGGLTMLNSVALRMFGESVLSPRIVLLFFALLWIPTAFWIARRFVEPAIAGVITFIAVVWGFPNYFAALPSWYNLIFATFAIAAVFRFMDTGARRWLVAAGVCAGASVLAKISGMFLIAALLLFLVDLERQQASTNEPLGQEPSRVYAALVTAGLVLFVVALAATLWRALNPAVAYSFLLPPTAVASYVGWRQWSSVPAGNLLTRVARLLGLAAPLLVGVAVPLLAFLLPFLRAHALADLVNGVFVLPQKRLAFVWTTPSALRYSLVAVLPIVAVMTVRVPTSVLGPVLAVLGLAVLALVPFYGPAFALPFLMARASVPVIVGAGLLLAAGVGLKSGARADAGRDLLLLVTTLALCSLVQFPYAAAVYFCYVAPLATIAGAAVLSLRSFRPKAPLVATAAFAAAYAMLWLNTSFLPAGAAMSGGWTSRYIRSDQTALLPLPRGQIRVSAADSAAYVSLHELVRQHAGGRFIWAGPDASQVYFMTGKLNPTPTDYDFFEDAATREARLLAALESYHVRLIVINRAPAYSSQLSAALMQHLHAQFPNTRTVERFTVAWR